MTLMKRDKTEWIRQNKLRQESDQLAMEELGRGNGVIRLSLLRLLPSDIFIALHGFP